MQLGLLESLWPQRTPNAAERSLEFHAGRFARWLNVAGAEPRFGLVLCAGDKARQRFIEHLEAEGVDVVVTTATDKRPLPRDLMEHRGDHFNKRFFLIDGFDNCDRLDVLRTLNGQRGQLRRMTTWCALLIESPETLATLYEVAPALIADVMRRCLVVDMDTAEERSTPVPAPQLNRWRRMGAIAELAFHTAVTGGETADYHDIARLFRTGYGTSVGPPYAEGLAACMSVWSGRDDLEQPQHSPVQMSALARHGTLAGLPDSLVDQHLAQRPFCRMAAQRTAQSEAEAIVLTAQRQPDKIVESPATVSDKINQEWGETPWGPVLAALVSAQVAAGQRNLAACGQALTELLNEGQKPQVAPELYFNALEYRIRFDVGLSRRSDARANLKRLEELMSRLHSPLYDGRTHLIRGDFIVALDPVMAKSEYQSAERLFSAHGYPEWSATALQRQERVR